MEPRQPLPRPRPVRLSSASAPVAVATWLSTSPGRCGDPASTGCRLARASSTRSTGPEDRRGLRCSKGSTAALGAASEDGPIGLGSATVEQLETIDGIGPVTASKIVEYRDQHGGLSSVDQLDEVSGIGPATMESLRARLQP